jgi:hypothetical protein
MIENYKSFAITEKNVTIYLSNGDEIYAVTGKLPAYKKLAKAICQHSKIKITPENLDTILLRHGTFRAIFYLGDRKDVVNINFDLLETEFEEYTKQLLKKLKPENDAE